MAKGKGKSNTKSYVSKGLRKNVSRKTLIDMRKDRKAKRPVEDVLAKLRHRDEVMRRGTAKQVEKLEKAIYVEDRATELYTQYQEVGITWAACVQAVKTDYISQLHQKWAPVLSKKNQDKFGHSS